MAVEEGFHNRSIELAYSSKLQLPKFITIRFLEDGLPTELNIVLRSIGSFRVQWFRNEFEQDRKWDLDLCFCHR